MNQIILSHASPKIGECKMLYAHIFHGQCNLFFNTKPVTKFISVFFAFAII